MAEFTPNRQQFKRVNRAMITLFRLGFGPILSNVGLGGAIMVLATIGRRSWLRRRTPVNYAIVGDDVYCTAGYGPKTDWYRNLVANSNVEVWIGNRWWAGVAETVSDEAVRLPILRQVWINSGPAAQTFLGIDPRTCPDEELSRAAADVPLVRIRRQERLSGYGGPGDLVLVWPLLLLFLALWRALRRR